MSIEAFTELSHPTCQAAIAAGSMCNRGGDGIRFGRVIKPNSTTGSFSADVVSMKDVVGPFHRHPCDEQS